MSTPATHYSFTARYDLSDTLRVEATLQGGTLDIHSVLLGHGDELDRVRVYSYGPQPSFENAKGVADHFAAMLKAQAVWRGFVTAHLHRTGSQYHALTDAQQLEVRLLADGYGDLRTMTYRTTADVETMLWDWSHVRDSGPAAVLAMAQRICQLKGISGPREQDAELLDELDGLQGQGVYCPCGC